RTTSGGRRAARSATSTATATTTRRIAAPPRAGRSPRCASPACAGTSTSATEPAQFAHFAGRIGPRSGRTRSGRLTYRALGALRAERCARSDERGGRTMKVVVLGAGFGGLELSSRLSEALGDEIEVTLIDRSEGFVFGFSKFDVMFGRTTT